MKFRTISTLLLTAFLVYSCSKDEETEGYLEPIKIVIPSTNPATVTRGNPLNYKVTLTHDQLIDSFKIYLQPDSFLTGYNASRDTIIYRDSILKDNKKNVLTYNGAYQPWFYPPVGKKYYMTFRFFSTYEKIINGVKTIQRDSIDKRLTWIIN